jgi:hypothetical protein
MKIVVDWERGISANLLYTTKCTQPFMSANVGRLNLHIKRITKCEIVTNIQDILVAKL